MFKNKKSMPWNDVRKEKRCLPNMREKINSNYIKITSKFQVKISTQDNWVRMLVF